MAVYDFACFLQAKESRPPKPQENADEWLNDTEEKMVAEDAAWEATYRDHQDEFLALRETAQAEIAACCATGNRTCSTNRRGNYSCLWP